MARRVEITVDLGADAPIEVIREVVDNLDTVCQFGGELHYRAAIADAEIAILRRPEAWISGRDYDELLFASGTFAPPIGRRGLAAVPAAILAPAVSRYLEANNATQDTITTVESIRYSNPIEIVLGIGVVALAALALVRDWPARRRVDAAVAADTENVVLARKQLRDELVRQIVAGNIPLSAPQVNELLTLDVARAMQALGDSRFTLRELEAPDEHADDTDP